MFVVVAFFSSHSYAQQVTPASDKTTEKLSALPFTLTISGGISLGSYEAGVNWALIEYARKMRDDPKFRQDLGLNFQPELGAVTGASAGSINAVMSAMLWLVDENYVADLVNNKLQGNTAVESNVLRDSWVSVGIDQLLPENESDYVNPDRGAKTGARVDTMFARKAFDTSVSKIRKLFAQKFHPNKKVQLALLATREDPIEIDYVGGKVKNQRFVFMLEFMTDNNGKGHFISRTKEADHSLGTVVYLPGKKLNEDTVEVELDDVIELMYASSAFPVAFGKINLSYCTNFESGESSSSCPNGTIKKTADFLDGGVFDNIPLGTARAIVNNSEVEDTENLFFFISPSTRRDAAEPFKNPLLKKERTFGLGGILSFIPGFIDTASNYELYDALFRNKEEWSAYDGIDSEKQLKLVFTSRFFPITGAFLGHFGAFLDQPFREFDYYAGVYDSINDMAKFTCLKNKKDSVSCKNTGNYVEYIYHALRLAKENPASTVFSLIATQEHKEYNKQGSSWQWIYNELPNAEEQPDTMRIIFNSMIETSKTPVTDDDSDDTFTKFVQKLRANKYIEDKRNVHSVVMKRIIERCDEKVTSWYAPLVGRAGKRLQNLQAFESSAKGNDGYRYFAGTLSLGLGRYFSYDDKFTLQPSSLPPSERSIKSWYSYIPYELGMDTANGGISISYLGQLRLPVDDLSLDLKFTPVGYNKFGEDRVWFSQADLYLSGNNLRNLFSIGGGPTASYLWQSSSEYNYVNLGVALYGEFFKTLRLTVGLRSFEARPLFGHNYYVTLGIVDLPGLVNRVVNNW